jgi:hypothetical protein
MIPYYFPPYYSVRIFSNAHTIFFRAGFGHLVLPFHPNHVRLFLTFGTDLCRTTTAHFDSLGLMKISDIHRIDAVLIIMLDGMLPPCTSSSNVVVRRDVLEGIHDDTQQTLPTMMQQFESLRDGKFKTVLQKVDLTSLFTTGTDNYTVFLPSPEALDAWIANTNIAEVKAAVQYHIVKGKFTKEDLEALHGGVRSLTFVLNLSFHHHHDVP